MPTQEYLCKSDGPFDVHLTFAEDVPITYPCPHCGAGGRHVLRPPAGLKFARTWNEQANECRRDTYTQAKAQSWNMYNEQRDLGVRVDKPTEASIQVAASALDRGERNPRPPAHQQQLAHVKRLKKKTAA